MRSLWTVSLARSCGPVMSISIPTFYAGIGILPQVGTYLDESFSRPERRHGCPPPLCARTGALRSRPESAPGTRLRHSAAPFRLLGRMEAVA